MSKKVEIFGIRFDNLTTGQIAEKIYFEINAERGTPLIVFTPNPEIVMSAQKDTALFNALNAADIICPDGVGIVWASKYFGGKINERASGVDVVTELFKKGKLTAFFFGGSEDSVTKAAAKMGAQYEGLCVSGTKNGYFNDDTHIIEEINKTGAGLLLVGLGSPKQELWVYNNAAKLNVKAIMVVGGSFDVMSGNIKRAPMLFQRLGLEWLYRLICQPRRLFRMMKLPQFVLKVLFARR